MVGLSVVQGSQVPPGSDSGLTLTFTWLRPLLSEAAESHREGSSCGAHVYLYVGASSEARVWPAGVPQWGSQALVPWHRTGPAFPLAGLSLEDDGVAVTALSWALPGACVRACVRVCGGGGLAPAQGRCSQEQQLGSRKQPWFPFSFLWLSEGPGWVMSLPWELTPGRLLEARPGLRSQNNTAVGGPGTGGGRDILGVVLLGLCGATMDPS